MTLLDTSHRRHDLAGRAVTALERILVDESLLHRVQFVTLRKSLDGNDPLPLHGECQCQAGQHAPTFDQHRASTALAVITTFFAPGKPEFLPQHVQQ